MELVNPTSFAATIDAVNEAMFFGKKLAMPQRRKAARWIASQQGGPGSYNEMFRLCPHDRANGIAVFTGERISTGAGTTHIMGEEACRALVMLDVDEPKVVRALQRARSWLDKRPDKQGMFCCGICSVSLWRNLLAGGISGSQLRLQEGAAALKRSRKGEGLWFRFPFYYTLLALSEMDFPSAREEKQYAAARIERLLKRNGKSSHASRRRDIMQRILAQC